MVAQLKNVGLRAMSGCAASNSAFISPRTWDRRVVGALDDGNRGVGLLRPAAELRRRRRRGHGVGDLAGERRGDADRGGAEHELAAIDEAVAEIDDRLIPQALAVGERQFAFAHGHGNSFLEC